MQQALGAQARLGEGTGAAYRVVRGSVPFIDAGTVLYPYAFYQVQREAPKDRTMQFSDMEVLREVFRGTSRRRPTDGHPGEHTLQCLPSWLGVPNAMIYFRARCKDRRLPSMR
jgi:hypothetical protein